MLSSVVHLLFEHWNAGYPIDWLLADLTHKDALALFHRLLAAESLTIEVSAPPDYHQDIALQIHSRLPDLRLPSHPEGIPEELLQVLVNVGDHLPVSEIDVRYPPPFDRVFPNNFTAAEKLLKETPVEHRQLVVNFDVVVAFLRYGSRFPFNLFPTIDDIEQISLIYPLLSAKAGHQLVWSPTMQFGMMLDYVFAGREDHGAALLAVPEFIERIALFAGDFVVVINYIIKNDLTGLFWKLAALPCFPVLLNAGWDLTIWDCAVRYDQFDVMRFLLEHDELVLTKPDGRPFLLSWLAYYERTKADMERLIDFIVAQPRLLKLIAADEYNIDQFCGLFVEGCRGFYSRPRIVA